MCRYFLEFELVWVIASTSSNVWHVLMSCGQIACKRKKNKNQTGINNPKPHIDANVRQAQKFEILRSISNADSICLLAQILG